MLTLDSDNALDFRFPEVHPSAGLDIEFKRTLRIPDDNRSYPLPPQFDNFQLHLVDDYAERLPPVWHDHGGVFLPMYPSEALWIDFASVSRRFRNLGKGAQTADEVPYPMAVKVAAGKINAVSGASWTLALLADPQDYVVAREQRWLDGFNVAKGFVRQFVASPPGQGYSVEEQLTGQATHGGLQIAVYPMKAEVYEAHREAELRRRAAWEDRGIRYGHAAEVVLSAGGLIRQTIVKDPFGIDAWDQTQVRRCFVHLLDAELYRAVTGEPPPQRPFAVQDYAQAGLPFFHYRPAGEALPGAAPLAQVASVAAHHLAKTGQPLPDNDPPGPMKVIDLNAPQVREGAF